MRCASFIVSYLTIYMNSAEKTSRPNSYWQRQNYMIFNCIRFPIDKWGCNIEVLSRLQAPAFFKNTGVRMEFILRSKWPQEKVKDEKDNLTLVMCCCNAIASYQHHMLSICQTTLAGYKGALGKLAHWTVKQAKDTKLPDSINHGKLLILSIDSICQQILRSLRMFSDKFFQYLGT